MYESIIGRKSNILVFESVAPDGTTKSFILGTDSLQDVVGQEWFAEFLSIATLRSAQYRKTVVPQTIAPVQQPVTAPQPSLQEQAVQAMQVQQQYAQVQQPRAQPPPMRTFMDLTPTEMNDKLWGSLNQQQQDEWYTKWKNEIDRMKQQYK